MTNSKSTTVHWFHDSPHKTKLAWPNGNVNAQWVTGDEAKEMYLNADYVCISHSAKDDSYWLVRTNGKTDEEPFRVRYFGWDESIYANLARELEEHAGRTGLVILVC